MITFPNFPSLCRLLIVRIFVLVIPVVVIALNFPISSFSEESLSLESWHDAPSIFVHIEATTWKTRGRFLYDVEGSLLKKMASSGFTIVRRKEDAHQLTLRVLYREDRGEPYDINAFGTLIHGTFYLDPFSNGSTWELHISETSTNSISGTPPYLDVLEKFESNPYYFFISEILRGHIEKKLDLRGGLIFALERIMAFDKTSNPAMILPDGSVRLEPHSMVSTQELYEATAIRRAIDDLVKATDRRIIPVLFQLLDHTDSVVRVRAIEALGSFQINDSRVRLSEMAQNDPDPHVRKTAQKVEKMLGSVTPPTQSGYPDLTP